MKINIDKISYKDSISSSFIKKEMLKNNIVLITGGSVLLLAFYLLYYFDPEFNFDFFLILTLSCILLPYMIIAPLSAWYFSAYVRNFSYAIEESNIVIHHGVFTKVRVTIPYRRIQNINITYGVFDRMFKTYTVKIETAGSSAVGTGTKSRALRPEGYIPGLKDPHVIEDKINEMIGKHIPASSLFEDKLFKPEAVAFDNFISYILSKMREGERLKTSIKELRKKQNMTPARLAEEVGVPIQTIKCLEEGRYNPSLALAYKIAEVLKCKIEELFEFT